MTDRDQQAGHISRNLEQIIKEEIRDSGPMSFSRFMHLALYHPQWGYYTGPSYKFGPRGDFITAPELGPLFARCLARQVAEILPRMPSADILEFGAGSGRLAIDLMLELQQLQRLPEHYYILEASGDLRIEQQQTIKQQLPHLSDRFHWLDALESVTPFRGVIFANEVLDALPVHRFVKKQQGLVELCVDYEDQWCWTEAEFSQQQQLRANETLQGLALDTGYTSELHFVAEDWLQTLCDILEQGCILLVDYGFPGSEYYHEQRDTGTLMCHYRHQSHTDPFQHVGLQDITSHVNFSSLARVAERQGLQLAGYTSQAYFLIANGLEQAAKLNEIVDVKEQLMITQNIKKLSLPNEMGELFKVIAFNKQLDLNLQGFSLYDHRHKL